MLALLPLVGSPFQVKFAGPYAVLRRISDQNYIITTPVLIIITSFSSLGVHRKKSQLCRVNLLKPYVFSGTLGERPVAVAASVGNPDPVSVLAGGEKEDVNVPDDGIMQDRCGSSESLSKLDMLLDHLSKKNQLIELIHSFPSLFSDTPSRTHLIEHDIDVGDAQPVRQRFYRVSPQKREQLEAEVKYMLEHDIAVPSSSS